MPLKYLKDPAGMMYFQGQTILTEKPIKLSYIRHKMSAWPWPPTPEFWSGVDWRLLVKEQIPEIISPGPVHAESQQFLAQEGDNKAGLEG